MTEARPQRQNHFELATEGRWISPSSNIVVEHGHQIDDANKFEGWPIPVAQAPSGIRRLRSPFGEALVRQFFDKIEHDHSVVDNITGGAGVLYGVKREGMVGSARVFSDFLKFVSLDTSWRQFGNFLGSEDKPPVWDVDQTRQDPVLFFTNAFPREDPVTPLVRDVLAQRKSEVESALAGTLAAMSEEDVQAICQNRYLNYLRAVEANVPVEERPSTCPRKSGELSYLQQNAVELVRGSLFYVRRYIENVVAQYPPLVQGHPPVTFVYGHTHSAMRATPLSGSKLSSYKVINTGAWQRIINGTTLAAMAKKNGWPGEQVLDRLKLSDLPACYSFVWIPFQYDKALEPKLRYWAYDKGGDVWRFTNECTDREALPPE